MCKPWILQRLYLHMYFDVILFVMCKEYHTICNVYNNLTQPMFGSWFISCLLEGACLIYVNCVCVCVHSGVQHTLCCVLALFYFVLLSASLDCHFWIALWYSLTFSYRRLTFPNCIWTPTFSVKHTNLCFFDLRIAITLWYIYPLTYVWSSLLVKHKYVVPYLHLSDK